MRGRPLGHGNDEDDCDEAKNGRQRRTGGNDKAVEVLPLAKTTLIITSASAEAMTTATAGTACSPRSGAVMSTP